MAEGRFVFKCRINQSREWEHGGMQYHWLASGLLSSVSWNRKLRSLRVRDLYACPYRAFLYRGKAVTEFKRLKAPETNLSLTDTERSSFSEDASQQKLRNECVLNYSEHTIGIYFRNIF